jgi:C-type mannose receptor
MLAAFLKRKNAIQRCMRLALKKGYKIFAIYEKKQCRSGRESIKKYKRYGRSRNCVDGRGGKWANSVYTIHKGKGSLH